MRSHDPDSGFDAALRRLRPSADATFVGALAQRVRAEDAARDSRRWRVPAMRSLVATALTAALFSALGAFGELGYAASGFDRAVSAIGGAIHVGKHSAHAHAAAAADQYHKPKTCREMAKEDYNTKVAADRHAYNTRVAAARRARDAALRKCKTRACRIAAGARFALEVAVDRSFRDDLLTRHRRSYRRLVRRCTQ